MHNWKLDFAVTEVKANGEGTIITVECIEKLPMPVTVEITEKTGSTTRISWLWKPGFLRH
jgi:hypothetical protein